MDFVILYLIFVNAAAFLLYGLDKWKAARDKWRIPEKTLILIALLGGTVGALLGMQIFRHKTKHLKFKIGLPLILALQLTAVYLILNKF